MKKQKLNKRQKAKAKQQKEAAEQSKINSESTTLSHEQSVQSHLKEIKEALVSQTKNQDYLMSLFKQFGDNKDTRTFD